MVARTRSENRLEARSWLSEVRAKFRMQLWKGLLNSLCEVKRWIIIWQIWLMWTGRADNLSCSQPKSPCFSPVFFFPKPSWSSPPGILFICFALSGVGFSFVGIIKYLLWLHSSLRWKIANRWPWDTIQPSAFGLDKVFFFLFFFFFVCLSVFFFLKKSFH